MPQLKLGLAAQGGVTQLLTQRLVVRPLCVQVKGRRGGRVGESRFIGVGWWNVCVWGVGGMKALVGCGGCGGDRACCCRPTAPPLPGLPSCLPARCPLPALGQPRPGSAATGLPACPAVVPLRRRVAWERGQLTPERMASMDHPITCERASKVLSLCLINGQLPGSLGNGRQGAGA